MLLTLAAALLLIGPGDATPPAAPHGKAPQLLDLPAADEDVRRALFEMLEREPDRRVCTVQVPTGSRQPRTTCGTLLEWFAQRTPAEVTANEAPWQLVEEIKKKRRKDNLRHRRGG